MLNQLTTIFHKTSLLESHTKKGDDLGVENGVTVAAEYSFKYPHHIVIIW